MNELKDVRLSDKLSDNSDDFILILQAFPVFCRERSVEAFTKWFEKNRPILRQMEGTMKEINRQIEELV